jgi:hypothetical protein
MINRENLQYVKNILSLHNKNLNLDSVYDVLTSIKEDDLEKLIKNLLELFNGPTELVDVLIPLLHAIKENDNPKIIDGILTLSSIKFNNIEELREILIPLLHAIKENDEFLFYTNILKYDSSINTALLNNVLKTIKHKPSLQDDIYDSYSENQFASKGALLKAIDSLDILNEESTVFIWGCWYGSILVPSIATKVKTIIGLDLDEKSITIGKKFFGDYNNVEFQKVNVFEKYLTAYNHANLIINTSCEHMPPMKEWKWFGPGAIAEDKFKGGKGEGFGSPKLSSNCYFAFQSNNMFGIEGHVNCVNSLEEFEAQLPDRAEILYKEEVEDTRGTRYMLVGKFNPL